MYIMLCLAMQKDSEAELKNICITISLGVDHQGRPVVVFIGRYFPANVIDLNKVIRFILNPCCTTHSNKTPV